MQDFEAHCFQNREDWLRLLLAYAQAEEVAAAAEAALAKVAAPPAVAAAPAVSMASDSEAEESANGWVARIGSIEGVETAQMSMLHGRVIALGYLKFKLIDRQVGLRYRLTPTGKQAAQTRPDAVEAAA
jgi:hypothetical protein